jgi:NAD+ diphosphatase
MAARDAGLGVTAVALAAWHASHRCCPRCGTPTVVGFSGWVRHCPNDGIDQYPRTDPAVIMAVVDDDDRLLLGHAAQWPERRFSTLAGYVEPGEGLEQAVRREVDEEVGVAVGEVTYRGSQPWPFPASIMLAFVARATSTEITVDGVEVTEARWFTRAELLAAASSGEVLLPSKASIARALVEEWAGEPLPGD